RGQRWSGGGRDRGGDVLATVEARQGDGGAIDREAQGEIGDVVALDVVRAGGALADLARGGAGPRGGRLVLDEGCEPGDRDALERGGVEGAAIVARGEVHAGAERAGECAAGEGLAGEDREVAPGGGPEQRLGAPIAEM